MLQKYANGLMLKASISKNSRAEKRIEERQQKNTWRHSKFTPRPAKRARKVSERFPFIKFFLLGNVVLPLKELKKLLTFPPKIATATQSATESATAGVTVGTMLSSRRKGWVATKKNTAVSRASNTKSSNGSAAGKLKEENNNSIEKKATTPSALSLMTLLGMVLLFFCLVMVLFGTYYRTETQRIKQQIETQRLELQQARLETVAEREVFFNSTKFFNSLQQNGFEKMLAKDIPLVTISSSPEDVQLKEK